MYIYIHIISITIHPYPPIFIIYDSLSSAVIHSQNHVPFQSFESNNTENVGSYLETKTNKTKKKSKQTSKTCENPGSDCFFYLFFFSHAC